MIQRSNEQRKDDEKKILVALQKFQKENIDKIAKDTGFSRQKVHKAIKEMEQNQTIWGYGAVVDEERQDLEKFMLLIKRATKKIDKKTADQLISYRTSENIKGLGINVINSYFAHGEYDWVLIFTAPDIRKAKKFSTVLLNDYPGMATKITLLQLLMTLRSQHILNPNYMKLREFL